MITLSIDFETDEVNKFSLLYSIGSVTLMQLINKYYSKIIPLFKISDISNKLCYIIQIEFKNNIIINLVSKYYYEYNFNMIVCSEIYNINKLTNKLLWMNNINFIRIGFFRKENSFKTAKHVRHRVLKMNPMQYRCIYCGKIEKPITDYRFKRCNRCHKNNIRYCSKECQIADWEKHKEVCGICIQL